MLKAYPLQGWQVVLGQMLTPVVVLTMIEWLFLLIIWSAGTTVAAVTAYPVLLTMLAVEIGIGIAWLGRRFENLDISVELRVG